VVSRTKDGFRISAEIPGVTVRDETETMALPDLARACVRARFSFVRRGYYEPVPGILSELTNTAVSGEWIDELEEMRSSTQIASMVLRIRKPVISIALSAWTTVDDESTRSFIATMPGRLPGTASGATGAGWF
jgi:hypothetical protein